MTRLTRTALTLATALGLAGAATTARADHDDRERDRDHRPPVVVTVPAPAPAPAYEVRVAPAPAPAYRAAPPWRTARWGGGRMQVLREDYRRLELSRDRFETSYARRRTELDERFAELERGHEHGRW
ncbi:MAG TPA: hypothetical protein VF400_02820 [Anaeromyxobacteraceae bacterium]